MNTPKKLREVKALVKNKVQENLTLEYKASSVLVGNQGLKIAKTVTSFAHSDGGVVIYGVEEENGLPSRVDGGLNKAQCTKETLEQFLLSHINPKVDGIIIYPLPLSKTNSIFVVEVPRSSGKVHQCSDNKYYKRHNFHSTPMEDYEINDVRNRKSLILPLINVAMEPTSSHIVYLTVSNVGVLPALNVSFDFPSDVLWLGDRETPSLFTKGIKYFPPNKTYRFMWNMFPTLFAATDERFRRIDGSVTYLHPQVNTAVTDEFHIDIEGHRGGTTIKSDVQDLKETIKEHVKNLVDEIKKLNQRLDSASASAGPTGLNLSITTLRNLKRVFDGEDGFEKIPAKWCSYLVFCEVLHIDYELASELETHFSHGVPEKLEDLKGVSPELIEAIQNNFYLENSN